MKYFFLIILSLFSLSHLGYARIIYYGDELETITLTYGGPTILRFPEPVKTISQASRFVIAPADEQQPNYALLSVTPRLAKGEDRVTFLLGDGSAINIKLVIVPKAIPEKTDSLYDLKRRDSALENQSKNQGEKVSELELMKAMIRGDIVAGYQIKKLSKSIDLGVAGISCELVRVYTGSKFNGYIFKIKNKTEDAEFKIDITELTLGLPNTALMSQIDSRNLAPEKETYLRIAAKPSSVFYNVHLPVEKIKKDS